MNKFDIKLQSINGHPDERQFNKVFMADFADDAQEIILQLNYSHYGL